MDRRTFLKSAGASVGLFGISGLMARACLAPNMLARDAANDAGGYGSLKPVKSENTGEVLLELPDGFRYTVFGRTGEKMTDGLITPDMHDGMAAFAYKGKVRLIRNHEVRSKPGSSIAGPEQSYDPLAGGGTSTLDIDPETRLPLAVFASLSGTIVNCAGGPTPWGSWITCEETTVGTHRGQVYHQDKVEFSYGKDHGYNFEVSMFSEGPVDPKPLVEMGRFVHEAVAVDPSTGIVYQTEDTGAAGFFRFIPNVPTQLHQGGKLQMARVKDKPNYDSRKGQKVAEAIAVDWVDIKNPDPSNATEKPDAVFDQGASEGGMTFGRLEGAWYGNGCIYLNSTDGGDARCGQIWRYRPKGQDEGELVMLFESPNKDVMDAPDNLCVSPRGGLAICEDGGGTNFVRGLTEDGRVFDFARNAMNNSEFAGACFSPDGRTLFVNIQTPGLTLAIWGPWNRGGL